MPATDQTGSSSTGARIQRSANRRNAFAGGLVPGFAESPSHAEKPHVSHVPEWYMLILGVQEYGCRGVLGSAITELNATALFLYFHIGIVRAAVSGAFESPALAAGVGHFFLIALLTFAFAAPSGAHMNPNVTLATVLIGHTTVYRFAWYAVAQLLGAILGSLAMRATLGWDDVTPGDLAACNNGSLSDGAGVICNAFLFHFLLCVIGGIAFDPRQGKVFGPILAPLFIASSISLIMFSSSALGDGFGPMLNCAECIGISVAAGEFNGTEWISFVGPTLASIVHSTLFIAVPPTHQEEAYVAPLLKPLRQPAEGSLTHSHSPGAPPSTIELNPDSLGGTANQAHDSRASDLQPVLGGPAGTLPVTEMSGRKRKSDGNVKPAVVV